MADDQVQLALNNNEPLACALFMLFRWGSLTKQVCPKCSQVDGHIPRPKDKQMALPFAPMTSRLSRAEGG